MQTGWIQDSDGKWYYLYSDGSMANNTTIDGYEIKKTKDPKSAGWIHSAKFYSNDKLVMDITFVNPIIINGDYFNITKGKLDTVTIGKFLKSIDPSYDVMFGL